MAGINIGGNNGDAAALQSLQGSAQAQLGGWAQLNNALKSLNQARQASLQLAEIEKQNLIDNTRQALADSGVDPFWLAQTPEGQKVLKHYYMLMMTGQQADTMISAIGAHWTPERFKEADLKAMLLAPEDFDQNMQDTLDVEAAEAAAVGFTGGEKAVQWTTLPQQPTVGVGGSPVGPGDGSGTLIGPTAQDPYIPKASEKPKPKGTDSPSVKSPYSEKLPPLLDEATPPEENFGDLASPSVPIDRRSGETNTPTENMSVSNTDVEQTGVEPDLAPEKGAGMPTEMQPTEAAPLQPGSGVTGEATAKEVPPVVPPVKRALTYGDTVNDPVLATGFATRENPNGAPTLVSNRELQHDIGNGTYADLTTIHASHPWAAELGVSIAGAATLGAGVAAYPMHTSELLVKNFVAENRAEPDQATIDEFDKFARDLSVSLSGAVEQARVVGGNIRQSLTKDESHSILFQIEHRLEAMYPRVMEYFPTVDPSAALDRVQAAGFQAVENVDYIPLVTPSWLQFEYRSGEGPTWRGDILPAPEVIEKEVTAEISRAAAFSPKGKGVIDVNTTDAAFLRANGVKAVEERIQGSNNAAKLSAGGYIISASLSEALSGYSMAPRGGEKRWEPKGSSKPEMRTVGEFLSIIRDRLKELFVTEGEVARRQQALRADVSQINTDMSDRVMAGRQARIDSGIYSTDAIRAVMNSDGSIRYENYVNPTGVLSDSLLSAEQLRSRDTKDMFNLQMQAANDAREMQLQAARIEAEYAGYRNLLKFNADIVLKALETAEDVKDIDVLMKSSVVKGAYTFIQTVWGNLLGIKGQTIMSMKKGPRRRLKLYMLTPGVSENYLRAEKEIHGGAAEAHTQSYNDLALQYGAN